MNGTKVSASPIDHLSHYNTFASGFLALFPSSLIGLVLGLKSAGPAVNI